MDRGREQLENAKGQLAEGAERVAAAVERTADELEGDGDGAISGFGRSVASLTRQLAGGLRERDIEEFARELTSLARRNPGVFLAGSVALGFGIARFFKAQSPSASSQSFDADGGYASRDAWQDGGQRYSTTDREYDAEDGLDLSAGSEWRDGSAADTQGAGNERSGESSEWSGSASASGQQQARTQRNGADSAGEEMDPSAIKEGPTSGSNTTSGEKQ